MPEPSQSSRSASAPVARNVLIFHSGALGDFVLSLPVALALARLYPTSRVRYVSASEKGRLASRLLNVEWVDVESGFSALFAEGATVAEPVRKLLSGAHRVVSYVARPSDVWTRRVKELTPQAAITHLTTVPEVPGIHALEWVAGQCRADRAVGGAVDQIVAVLGKQGLARRSGAGGRGVLIHPGAGSEGKCWPVENFRELALRLRSEGEVVHWVLGEVERERMPGGERRAMEALGDVVVPGDYVGLLEEIMGSAVFVGNDSGPGHLAAMSGVATVSVFGGTDPAVWRPVGPLTAVVGSKDEGVKTVGVDRVYERVRAFLTGGAGGGG